MADKKNQDVSELSVKDLAEPHLEDAVAQLGRLMRSDDPEVSLQATRSIIDLARLRLPGRGFGGWGWPGEFGGFGGIGGIRAG